VPLSIGAAKAAEKSSENATVLKGHWRPKRCHVRNTEGGKRRQFNLEIYELVIRRGSKLGGVRDWGWERIRGVFLEDEMAT